MREYDVDPIIILPGISHSFTGLTDKKGNAIVDKNGKQIGDSLFFVKTDKVKQKYLPRLLAKMQLSLITKDYEAVENAAYSLACEAFSYQECDNNGNYVNKLKTRQLGSLAQMDENDLSWAYCMVPMQRLVDKIGKDKVYFYTFNLVGDPIVTAQNLDKYIDNVLKETGKERVTLMPVSLGGTILCSYLDLFGFDKVSRIVGIVACLDGSDIVADMMERKFKISDEFLRHTFLPMLFSEFSGNANGGYIANILLNKLPRGTFNAVLTGCMSGILDTVMTKCPQMWAMVPSHRYDILKEKYLMCQGREELRRKTDAFQKARLNLKDTLLKAYESGVKIDTISGSNLSFGEKEYSFFSVMDSADKLNTDGVISLKSTSLGAFGVPIGETLGENYEQKNPYKTNDYSYISPDNRIDASTAIFPDNTWIFLNQHHEIGNNDQALNLIENIVLGNIENVHTNPEQFPQFNYCTRTKEVRRWLLPDLKKLLEEKADELKGDREIVERLIIKAEHLLKDTIANENKAKTIKNDIEDILSKYGMFEKEKKKTLKEIEKEKRLEKMSYKTMGEIK